MDETHATVFLFFKVSRILERIGRGILQPDSGASTLAQLIYAMFLIAASACRIWAGALFDDETNTERR
ncbi:MAG: hypothetical protein ABIQ90_03110, partial [Polaromonas sp.]